MGRIPKKSLRTPLPSTTQTTICYLCSKTIVDVTREHIFSRQFFLPDELEKPPILPACRKCNEEKGRDEEYVYPHFILMFSEYFAKDQDEYFFDNVARPFMRKFHSNKQEKGMGLLTPIHNYMIAAGERGRKWYAEPPLELDTERFHNFYVRIAKGLFTLANGEPTDWNDYEIYVRDETEDSDKFSRAILTNGYIRGRHRDVRGDSLLLYGGFVEKIDKHSGNLWSNWTIGFYNAHAIGVAFLPKNS